MSTKGPTTGGTDHLFGRPTRWKPGGTPGPGQSGGTLNPSLRELVLQFDEASREARRIAEGLSDQQFNWRPRSGRWSIAECFAHLNIVGSEMLPVIDSAVAEARSRGWYSNAPFKPRLLGRWLLRATEPPARHKRRSREEYLPSGDQPVKEGLPALLDLNELVASRAQAANGLDLSRPRVEAPVGTIFRISLFELLLFLGAHTRRHLRQARDVKEQPQFPKAPTAPVKGRPAPPLAPAR
jgi:hypothetical protein